MIVKRICCLLLIAMLCLVTFSGCSKHDEADEYQHDLLNARLQSLWETIEDDSGLVLPEQGATVFLSLCDGDEQATVVHASGGDLKSAWKLAEDQAYRVVASTALSPVWVRADIVTDQEPIERKGLEYLLSLGRDKGLRYGFALDEGLETAFLEAEANANGLYDYAQGTVSEEQIRSYLSDDTASVPGKLTLFTTQGYFCGNDNLTHRLIASAEGFGRRDVVMDADAAVVLASMSSSWLADRLDEDGKFSYGYYAASAAEIPGYNMVRHIGCIWSLLECYKMHPSEELARKIDLATNYFIENSVVFQSDYRAFILDGDEIKLGGNAMAVIALTEYAEVFQSGRHNALCEALGNGILAMGDDSNGIYQHVWTPAFSLKDPMRVIYYDGEATFALCKLYGMTKNAAYLKMAKAAVEHFIDADYTQYKDHWVAYAVNEITKYDLNERYFAFALQNAQSNLDAIISQDTSWHTYTELLMAAYDTYQRILDSGVQVQYLSQFDAARFLDAIRLRAEKGLSSFGFPEVVMYFQNPQLTYGSFFVRHDNFRMRIDDVQHFTQGYFAYAKSKQ